MVYWSREHTHGLYNVDLYYVVLHRYYRRANYRYS